VSKFQTETHWVISEFQHNIASNISALQASQLCFFYVIRRDTVAAISAVRERDRFDECCKSKGLACTEVVYKVEEVLSQNQENAKRSQPEFLNISDFLWVCCFTLFLTTSCLPAVQDASTVCSAHPPAQLALIGFQTSMQSITAKEEYGLRKALSVALPTGLSIPLSFLC
jgi:hypothetical protein